jgi:hypothetical protein
METLKTRIELESRKEYDDFMLHLFTACCKSTNSSFRRFASDLKSDWETDKVGSTTTEAEVINLLNAKWNNECVGNPKDTNKVKSTETKETKYLALISALTTNVQALSQKVQSMQKGNPSGDKVKTFTHDIAEWRKTKNLGSEVTKEGKTYYWCGKHADGKGLYVTHHPLDHGKHPKDWEHTRKTQRAPSGGPNTGASSNLHLNDTMKAALTSSSLSEAKANAVIESLKGNDGVDFW